MRLFIFLTLFATPALSQYRGYNWVVPDSAGIDFTTTPPSLFNSSVSGNKFAGPGHYLINAACISDEQGNLLLYTDGYNVYDRNHDTMPNGYDLASASNIYSGSLVLPYPAHEDSLYLVVHSWMFNLIHAQGIYYTVVNMNKRGGLGDVDPAQKNVLAFASTQTLMQLVAIRHANGRDWWVIGKKSGSASDYYKLLVTPNGVEYVGEQNVGFLLDWWCLGEMCVNPQGNQLAFAMYAAAPLGSSEVVHRIEVLDFDRCSGSLSNPQYIHPTVCYVLSYSPNGKLLYYNTYDTLFQVSGLDGSQPVSTTPLWFNPYYDPTSSSTLDSSYGLALHELAPDGKIYISFTNFTSPSTTYTPQNMSLCTIDSPDVQGVGCSFQLNSFYLNGKRSTYGLPHMPNYNLGKLEDSACDTLHISIEEIDCHQGIALYPNPSSGTFTLDYKSDEDAVVRVVDVLGRLVTEKPVLAKHRSVVVDVSWHAAGTYFVSVQGEQSKTSLYQTKLVLLKE